MMIHGTITKTLDDGTEAECAYMIDTDKGELIQVGGEAEIVAEDIDLIAAMLLFGQEQSPDEEATE
jgi:hypothetical protein